MKKTALFGVPALLFAFCALPLLAAPDPAASAAFAAIFAPAPEVSAQPQAQDVAARRGLPTKSTSTANCWDGSTVTCTGTSSSAVNSNCAAGQRGYCTGTTTGTIYCPVCSTGTGCTATAVCSNGSTVSCTGSTAGGCFALRNCYADCGGPLVWCPNHPSCPV
jgi:hypothetical protein